MNTYPDPIDGILHEVVDQVERSNIYRRKHYTKKDKKDSLSRYSFLDTMAIIYVFGILLNILLNFILIPKYSYFGAAIATSITYLFLFALLFVKTKNYIKLDHKYLKLPRIIISTIIMTLAIAFIHPQNVFTKLATIFFGAGVYLLSLYVTRAYVKEEMKLIKSFIPGKRN